MSRVSVFPRRYYAGLRQFLADAAWLFRHRAQLRQARVMLSPAFRERLMLAVTAVNRCRYCSFAHTRMALAAGVSNAEIAQILIWRSATARRTKRQRLRMPSTGRKPMPRLILRRASGSCASMA